MDLQDVMFPATVFGSDGEHSYGDVVFARLDGWRDRWPFDDAHLSARRAAADEALLADVDREAREAVASAVGELASPSNLRSLAVRLRRITERVRGVPGIDPPREVGVVMGARQCFVIFR